MFDSDSRETRKTMAEEESTKEVFLCQEAEQELQHTQEVSQKTQEASPKSQDVVDVKELCASMQTDNNPEVPLRDHEESKIIRSPNAKSTGTKKYEGKNKGDDFGENEERNDFGGMFILTPDDDDDDLIHQEPELTRNMSLPGAVAMPGLNSGIPVLLNPLENTMDIRSQPDDAEPSDIEDVEAASSHDAHHELDVPLEATLVVEPPVYEAQKVTDISTTDIVLIEDEDKEERYCSLVVRGRRISCKKRSLLFAAVSAIVIIGISIAIGTTSSSNKTKSKDIESQENRFDDLFQMASELSGSDVLQDGDSPQYKALDWLANVDKFKIDLTDTARLTQRYVLALIYYSTGGAEWKDDYGFLADTNECEWSDSTSTFGIDACNEDYVTSLDFYENNLRGTIPTEIGHLTNLTAFRTLGNNVEGTIPTEFGLLTKMQFFSFVRNKQMDGHIPSELGKLKSMFGFWVNSNSFSGTIPSELGEMNQTRFFGLRDNHLTGDIPQELAHMTGVDTFELHLNNLEGSAEFMCDAVRSESVLRVDKNLVQCSCCECCDVPSERYVV